MKPGQKIEELVQECRRFREWLEGPGLVAGGAEFARTLSAYRALYQAASMLRGRRYLVAEKAAPRAAVQWPQARRSAASFTADEQAELTEPVLTLDGWLMPRPLVPHVDGERKEINERKARDSKGKSVAAVTTSKEALESIIGRLAAHRGKRTPAAAELQRWQTRLSRERLKLERLCLELEDWERRYPSAARWRLRRLRRLAVLQWKERERQRASITDAPSQSAPKGGCM